MGNCKNQAGEGLPSEAKEAIQNNMIGKTISHYRVLEKLGGGGMGVVYKAIDLKLDRPVALKFLPYHYTSNEELKERFILEAKTASALQHNNICTIHEIDETEDLSESHGSQLFICMDYYEGETLKGRMERGRLDPNEALKIIIQIAGGLSKAHDKGIVHRDIKPANIFITNDGVVKILDFGLARTSDRTQMTQLGTTVGTVAYMSPEQARGEEVGKGSDVWSLGVLFYQMLTGKLPFKGDYDQVLIYSILNEEYEKPSDLRDDIPDEIESIISKALEKETRDRYPDAEEMLDDLVNLSGFNYTGQVLNIKKNIKHDKNKKKLWISALSISVIASLIFLYFNFFRSTVDHNQEKINIAVLSAENQTGDRSLDYLSKVIPNLFISNLEQSSLLNVMTFDRIHELLKQIGREDAEFIDKEIASEISKIERIDAVVIPSYTKIGNTYSTNVKVVDLLKDRVLKSDKSMGEGIETIFNQVDKLSEDIAQGVGLTPGEIESVKLRMASITTASLEAYTFYSLGNEQIQVLDWNSAADYFNRAIALDSNFVSALHYLSVCCYYKGNYERMNEAFFKAWDLRDRATEKERLIMEIWLEGVINSNYLKRLKLQEELVNRFPNSKSERVTLGLFYYYENLLDESIYQYNKALELDPFDGNSRNNNAYNYILKGEYDKALKLLEEYKELYPNSANPYDSMGELYLVQGDYVKAEENYKISSQLNADYGSIFRIAYIYALKEDYISALSIIERASQYSSLELEASVWKGFLLFWTGQFNSGNDELNRALRLAEIQEDHRAVEYILDIQGWIYFYNSEFEKAESKFRGSHTKRTDTRPYNTNISEIMRDLGLILINSSEGKLDTVKYMISGIKAKMNQIHLLSPAGNSPFNYLKLVENQFYSDIFECDSVVNNRINFRDLEFNIGMYTNNIIPRNIRFKLYPVIDCYIQKGLIDRAIDAYERLCSPRGSQKTLLIYPLNYYKLGELYYNSGKFAEAKSNFEKFVYIVGDTDIYSGQKKNALRVVNEILKKSNAGKK